MRIVIFSLKLQLFFSLNNEAVLVQIMAGPRPAIIWTYAGTFNWCITQPWCMMTSSNGNIFCFIGPLCREFTAHRWIPLIKASNMELWCFLWPAPEQSRCWWVEMPSHSLWCHCDGVDISGLLCRKYIQATGLDAWASRVKCPARFVSHLHDICIYMSCL